MRDELFQFTHPGRGATARILSNEIPAYEFQFTHPGRGATAVCNVNSLIKERFNSRTPGGVRQLTLTIITILTMVSIHAPREGCDSAQDTLEIQRLVSIHAPREGCDDKVPIVGDCEKCFNSRTPGGVRRPCPFF